MSSRRSNHNDAGHERSQRQLRVGEEIRHALAELLARGDFRDPELVDLKVTVTEVRVSPDLRNATAFVTPLGGGDVAPILTVLKRAGPFLRGQVAHVVNLKYAPTLSFEPDTSFDYAARIDRALHDPRVARDLGATRPGTADDED